MYVLLSRKKLHNSRSVPFFVISKYIFLLVTISNNITPKDHISIFSSYFFTLSSKYKNTSGALCE